MTVDWDGYVAYQPIVSQPLSGVSRAEAKAEYARQMATKADRIAALRRLLAQNGIDLDDSEASVRALHDWYRDNVEAGTEPGRLRSIWYAVAYDIGMYLGERMIERSPGLHWSLDTSHKRALHYQRPVITGFSGVANPRYNIDPGMIVVIEGQAIVEGGGSMPDYFGWLLRSVASKA